MRRAACDGRHLAGGLSGRRRAGRGAVGVRRHGLRAREGSAESAASRLIPRAVESSRRRGSDLVEQDSTKRASCFERSSRVLETLQDRLRAPRSRENGSPTPPRPRSTTTVEGKGDARWRQGPRLQPRCEPCRGATPGQCCAARRGRRPAGRKGGTDGAPWSRRGRCGAGRGRGREEAWCARLVEWWRAKASEVKGGERREPSVALAGEEGEPT